MGYPGGKAGAGVYQRLINQIPPHAVYVEPFLGDGAILRRKLPAARTIGVEVDPAQAQRFLVEALAAGLGGKGLEVHCCDGIEWLRHAFGLCRLDPACGSGVARSTNPSCRLPITRRSRSSSPVARSGGQDLAAESSGVGRPAPWFIYCDPPYLRTSRRSRKVIYRHEMTEAQHADLLEVIQRLPCSVAISGYWSRLYAEALAGWRVLSFDAMTRGGPAKEFLWCNFPEPTELHDYRYLGEDKRQRERIGRKVRTWVAGLRRLPRLERLAIASAIGADQP